jgi:phosphatidylserine/phosphatidylglycerophosphate/cardiolipin synthase-like enzyme
MRSFGATGPLAVRAISGTRVVLLAWNLKAADRSGLHGFAIKRGIVGSGKPEKWLTGLKYFEALVTNPKPGASYSTIEQPIQSFLWSDYEAAPGTRYKFTVVALYGDIHALDQRHSATLQIETEKEDDKTAVHRIWFNRGVVASHAHQALFDNAEITEQTFNKVDANGQISDREVKWLSRGLAEACIDFINGAKAGDGLRVCAYEFTYQPVLSALKRASDRSVDVKIVFHDSKAADDNNRKAIATAKLPNRLLFPRTRTKIPHNKFIVKLSRNRPIQVWTGSTNFTPSGFFGQTNVAHLITDETTAQKYLEYWTVLSNDPTHKDAVAQAVALTPNPPNVIADAAIVPFYSPRIADNMLDWYGNRIDDAAAAAVMTIPFNVAPIILEALSKPRDALRLVILEDPPTQEVLQAEHANKGSLVFSNGAILGKVFVKHKGPFGGATVGPITGSKLDRWFVDEELALPSNKGHVFFVHSKILLIDPLSNDPLVCTGSANFSTGSLQANDENMLLIRGNKRVADIYFTEFDRIFRHFFARDWINKLARRPTAGNPLLLDTTAGWVEQHFKPGTFKNCRRLLFFPDVEATRTWTQNAARDPDPFAHESKRAGAKRKQKIAGAKLAAPAGKARAKTGSGAPGLAIRSPGASTGTLMPRAKGRRT